MGWLRDLYEQSERLANLPYRRMIHDLHTKENDPMQITIRIREIANGVLVSADNECDIIGGPSNGETFYPSMVEALSELPGIGAEAVARQQKWREQMEQEAVMKRSVIERDARYWNTPLGGPDAPKPPCEPDPRCTVESQLNKLPEEAAVEEAAPDFESNTFSEDVEDEEQATYHPEHAFHIGTRPLPDQDDDQIGRDEPE
jgi:hypothetical protein